MPERRMKRPIFEDDSIKKAKRGAGSVSRNFRRAGGRKSASGLSLRQTETSR